MGNKMIFFFIIFLITILGTTTYNLKPHPFDDYIEWLTANSEFEYNGEEYPQVIYLSDEEMQITAYTQERIDEAKAKGRAIPHIKALYDHRENIIMLQEGTDLESYDSAYIVVHELVHFLQMINGVTEKETCKPSLEEDAYRLQYSWQIAHNHPGPYPNFLFVQMITSSCYKQSS